MANQNTAYGLRPIGLVGSATNSTGVTQYEIASDNTNAIFNIAFASLWPQVLLIMLVPLTVVLLLRWAS
jgi:hypothetical protein